MEINVEKSLVLIKPDAIQRGLIGEITKRLENRGLILVAAKFMEVSQELGWSDRVHNLLTCDGNGLGRS